MYVSFQSDSVNYSPKNMIFWRKLLNSNWNTIDVIDGSVVNPDDWFINKYGIKFDRNDRDIIVGLFISDEDYTMLLLQAHTWD